MSLSTPYVSARRERLRQQGLCPTCGACPPERERAECRRCLDYRNQSKKDQLRGAEAAHGNTDRPSVEPSRPARACAFCGADMRHRLNIRVAYCDKACRANAAVLRAMSAKRIE